MNDRALKISDYAHEKSRRLAERFGISQKRALELAIDALDKAAENGEIVLTELKEPRADYSAKKGRKNGQA